MKKILSTAALTVLTGLLLSGCVGAPASPEPSANVSDMAEPGVGAEPSAGAVKSPATDPAASSDFPVKSSAPLGVETEPTSPMSRSDEEAQRASLMTELQKIDPALNEPRILHGVMRQCRLNLNNAPEKVQLVNIQRLLKGTEMASGAASDTAAKKIIDVIKNNEFCKAAA